jgi:hypothetical protein
MPPTTLAVDSLNDRHQSCASRIHMSPLLLWKKVCPSIDPVGNFVDNLQKGSTASIVKDSIVTAIPNSQIRAQTPILIRALDILSIPFNQLPNMFLILAGAAY